MSLSLIDFYFVNDFLGPIHEGFSTFFNQICEKNAYHYKGKFTEEFHMVNQDLRLTRSVTDHLISNAIFNVYFGPQMNQLTKNILEKSQEINFKKISLALDLLYQSGYQLDNLRKIDFDKINYRFYDLVKFLII